MRTLTCKELGGSCDQKLSAESWDDMVKTMSNHVLAKHPQVAKKMEAMHHENPKQWAMEMKPKWETAREH
ncbi:MAG TPA: hypothetical protein VN693_07065 [Rhodanobacteraceae bacterium]|nr:hypothetical protein [Rhodanobacteraceae bacterium]